MLPLPAPEVLQDEMNNRFILVTTPQGLAWGGLILKKQQWMGDKPKQPAKAKESKTMLSSLQKTDQQQQLTFEA